jgi:hypothetical protein
MALTRTLYDLFASGLWERTHSRQRMDEVPELERGIWLRVLESMLLVSVETDLQTRPQTDIFAQLVWQWAELARALPAGMSLPADARGVGASLPARYGRLQEVPSDRGLAQLQVEETITDLDRILRALADGASNADVRLQEGLRLKNRLRSFIEETRDEGVRSQRQLAILMYDAVRRVHAEDLTRTQISALADCLTDLGSLDLGPSDLSKCDVRLLSVGLDSLPDIPE